MRTLLSDYHRQLADVLHQTALLAGLEGMRTLAGQLPELPEPANVRHVLRAYLPRLRGMNPAETRAFASLLPPAYREELRGLEPKIGRHLPPEAPPLPEAEKLPLVAEAAESLRQKAVLTRAEFDALSARAKSKAFTVAGQETRQAVDKIQKMLAQEIEQGPDKRGFVKKWKDELGASPLGEAHMEGVFRDAVQKSYAEGQNRMVEHPLVRELFPYVATEPIYDNRLSELCRVFAQSGIQGTNIFRVDDPVWKKYQNPRHFRCRCGRVYLTVEQAAARGIKEAIRWQKSGRPPASPAFVKEPPVKLPKGWTRPA